VRGGRGSSGIAFGRSASRSIEVYDPGSGTWEPPIPLPASFDYLFYPWTYLLPGGDLFILVIAALLLAVALALVGLARRVQAQAFGVGA